MADKTKVFLLGGNDFNMEIIRQILTGTKDIIIEDKIEDKKLPWGAYLEDIFNKYPTEEYEIYGIKLKNDIENVPSNYTAIDDQPYAENNPSSIELVCQLIDHETLQPLSLFRTNLCFLNNNNNRISITNCDSIAGKLKNIGVYKGHVKYYFCIDFEDKPQRLYYEFPKNYNNFQQDLFLKKLSQINWDSLLNQKIRIERYGGLVLLRNHENKLKYINYYGHDPRINNAIDSTFGKEIVDFERDSNGEFFVTYKDENGNICYFGSEATVSLYSIEGQKIKNELYSFDPSDEDAMTRDISQHFNREEDDIKEFITSYETSSIISYAGSTELKDYITDPEEEERICGDVLFGAFTRGGYGQAIIRHIRKENITSEIYQFPEDVNLFQVVNSGGIPTLDYLNISFIRDDNEWIVEKAPDKYKEVTELILKGINSNILFRNYLSEEVRQIYLWLSFEDATPLARSYNSYFFALSEHEGLTDVNVDNFLRYLMYIKYVENTCTNEEKHKKAIASAIAAIMSRNMSHNLGSHFLYYSQQDFANLGGSLRDMFYEKGKPEEKVFVENNSLESLLHQIKESYKYTKGASKVFEFLQDRMYYLAAITGIEKSQSLPVLLKSQILDFITDETDYRNFYLNNLVRSEQYTLEPKTLSIKLDDDSKDLDDVSISLPLGSVSIHAIYNIFENFIRNSAKYQWAGRPKPNKLEFTIKVIRNKKDDSDITIQIFDNKTSANRPNDKGVTLIDFMSAKLQDIRFLDDDDSLNNDDKGLKEMLLSAFWINNRQKDKSIGEIIYDFEKSRNKEAFLKNYGIVFVADSEGNLGVEFHVNKHYYVLRQGEIKDKPYLTSDIVIVSDAESKEYEYGREVSEDDGIDKNTTETLDKYVVEGKNEDGVGYDATKYLLSVVNKNLGENFDSQYVLCINSRSEKNYYPNVKTLPKIEFTDHLSTKTIIKKDELKEEYNNNPYYDTVSGGDYTKQIDIFFKNRTQGYPFNRQYKKWIDKYRSILIKESAITRITIVDERIFNLIQYLKLDSYTEGSSFKGTSLELDFRNIQVLNLKSSVANNDYSNYTFTAPHLVGNLFRKDEIDPHFISIHLGIIQQIVKNKNKPISSEVVAEVINELLSEIIITNAINSIHFEKEENDASAYNFVTRVLLKIGCKVDSPLVNRILQEDGIVGHDINQEKCLYIVRRVLKESDCRSYEHTRVAIHTGRGSLSEQEKKALAVYPIIPFGTLRSAFLNSKFILCQLFYNLKYKK